MRALAFTRTADACTCVWASQARTNPDFAFPDCMSVQRFTNAVCSDLPMHEDMMNASLEVPSFSSKVSCKDGYKPQAMLFVDEEFARMRAQRETRIGSLMFRPVVRFCSSHYKYIRDDKHGVRIVQVGIGHDDLLDGLGFRAPPSQRATAEAAKAAEPLCVLQA